MRRQSRHRLRALFRLLLDSRWLLGWVVAFLVVVAPAARADITVSAQLDTVHTAVGQPVTLSIEVRGAQNVQAPALSGLDDFDAQYLGPSTQVSIVHGQISASIQHRYSLTPRKTGRFVLGPFDVEHGGQSYQTSPLELTVSQGSASADPRALGEPSAGGERLRLVVTAPKKEVYLHEILPLEVTLYVGAVQVSDVQYPKLAAEGLSMEPFDRPRQFSQMIDGSRWDVVQFNTTVIPLQTGTRVLGPAIMGLNLVERQRQGGIFNDPFFSAFASRRRSVELRSDPVEVTVLPLPEEGRPPSFSGAVGQFEMSTAASPTEVTAGDPITLRTVLQGNGNLSDARPPTPIGTAGFKTYDPQATDTPAGALRVFEQVLIPDDASATSIPSVSFSYFDPEARAYRTLETAPIAISVKPAEAEETRILTASGERTLDQEKLGRDIVYIKDDLGAVRQRSAPWYGSWLFLLWQPVPLVLLAVAFAYDRHRRRLSGDVRYARFMQAKRNARGGLARAEAALSNPDPATFYDELSRTLQSYLADKLGLPPGATDVSCIEEQGVSGESAAQLRELFAICEQVRFSSSSADGDRRNALARAKDLVARLERECTAVPKDWHERDSWRYTSRLFLLAAATALFGAAPAHPREMPREGNPQTRFFMANTHYQEGAYSDAVRDYEWLLNAGIESGHLYFNLGNAYFKLGDLGAAIASYERARHRIPGDPDVAANLAYARSLTGAEPCRVPLWQRILFPLRGRWATATLAWVLSAFYTLAVAVFIVHLLLPSRPRSVLYAAAAFAAMGVAAGASLADQVVLDEWPVYAVVVGAEQTAARFEPADDGTVHFTLPQGSKVRVTEQREGWLQIARCDGRRGWVAATRLERL
jgi:tetratricopeptide (TPR) repeat protein